MRSEKEMIWMNASRIVATVTHAQAIWDRPKMQFKRKSVCGQIPFTSLNSAVAGFVQIADPDPAAFGLLDPAPKSLINGSWLCHGFAKS